MPIKIELHINCPICGKVQRTRRSSEGYWYKSCNCKKVPGPTNVPRIIRDSAVIWVS